MTTFNPRPYQTRMIAHMLAHARCAVWAGMGMGKTVSTLTALQTLSLIEPGPALIVAPLRVAVSTWPDEARKWEHTRSVRVSVVCGGEATRKRALAVQADLYTTNYEQLPWLVEHYQDAWPFTTVVIDESTRLKGFRAGQGTQRARAFALVAHKHVERLIALTGTPSPNGLQDLWGQLWFVDRGERLGRSFGAFTGRWFKKIQVGAFAHKLAPLAHAQNEIQDAVRDVCLCVRAEDYFEVTAPIMNTIRVELPPGARKQYAQMEREMFLQIGEAEIEAPHAAAKTLSCLQLASGAIYTTRGATEWLCIHGAKIDALASIVNEAAGAPVLVAYHFSSDKERILAAFAQARVLDAAPQTLRDWNAGRIPLLLAHPESAGHGLNLQDGGNILVFFSHWWALEPYLQMIERIGPTRQAQAGHQRAVFVHHIVAADTVDELVMRRRATKREVQDLLLDAMR